MAGTREHTCSWTPAFPQPVTCQTSTAAVTHTLATSELPGESSAKPESPSTNKSLPATTSHKAGTRAVQEQASWTVMEWHNEK